MSEVSPQISSSTNSTLFSREDQVPNVWEDLASLIEHGNRARAEDDPHRAFILYSRATELDPNLADAWVGRAETASNIDDAITSWAYALSLAPDHRDAFAKLTERIDERIAQSHVADVRSLVSLGRSLAEVGQKTFAHKLLARATELDDTNEDSWIWRAGVSDDAKEMISCLNQVLALNPKNTQALDGLQWAMSLQAQSPEAAVPSSEEQAAQLVAQGQALLQKGARQSAHDCFLRATELDQYNEMAWLWRGSTTPDVDEALTCMEQALAINPGNESAREARSWLRVKKLREGIRVKGQSGSAAAVPGPVSLESQKKNKIHPLTILIALVLLLALATAVLVRMFI